MMTMSSGMSAGGASGYFEKEDYYLKGDESNNQWIGKGAEALGLTGTIEKDDFRAVVAGIDPQTGEQLVAGKAHGDGIEERRAGNDATFSAPKSVSIAYAAGVEGVKDAHDAAVTAVAEYIEQHYSHARTPDGYTAGSLVAAKFDHATSRAGDPQLHSHLFVANATQTEDGKWRANDPINLYKDQKALGELYRQELANQLEKQGHSLDWTDRGKLQYEIKGVDAEQIKVFSARREAIEAKVAEWNKSGQYQDLTKSQRYEQANLQTRDAKDPNISAENIKEQWTKSFEKAGTSAEQIKANIERIQSHNIEQKQIQEQTGVQPGHRSIDDIVKSAAKGLTASEAVVSRATLMQTAAEISGGKHSIAEISKSVDANTEKHESIGGRETRTTTAMRELESRNMESLKTLAGTEFKSQTTTQEVKDYLSQLEKNEGIKLSEGQQAHVINELAGKSGLAVTQGDPGTGKTFASEIVERFNKEILQPSGREHYTLNAAFTGKAASEMSEASGKTAYTIDSFINAYNSGNIKIVDQSRAEQHATAQHNRADSITGTASQHAAAQHSQLQAHMRDNQAAHQIVGIGARNNQDLLTPGRTSLAVDSTGFRINYEHAQKAGILGTGVKWENSSRSINPFSGQKAQHSGSRDSNIFQAKQTGQGSYTDKNGNKIEYKETKTTNNLTTVQRSTRVERSENTVKRTESKTFAGKTTGITRSISRNGESVVTKWEGQKNWSGQFEITKSTTTRSIDEKAATKEFSSMLVRSVLAAERTYNLAKSDIVKVASVFGLMKADKSAAQEKLVQEQIRPQSAQPGQPGQGQSQSEPALPGQQQQQQAGGKQITAIPRGSQVVLKIDEASFVGAKHAEQLLKIANELKAQGVETKILAVGDTKQLQNISAGKFFAQSQQIAQKEGNFAALKEINRQKDPQLLDVAKTLNRDGDAKQLATNAKEALQKLDQQGRITEIKGQENLKQATVDAYMRESNKLSNKPDLAAAGGKQSVVVVTATNRDRQELNTAIRNARIEAGEIKQGVSVQTMQSVQRGSTADSYKMGDQIQFSGERNADGKTQAWGAQMGVVGTVTGINADKNTVQVHYSFDRSGQEYNVTKSFSADQLSQKTTAYEQQDRQFAAGDKIMIGKNDKSLDVKNGQTGTIQSINEDGSKIKVAMDNGKTVNIDTAEYKNLDHGYAGTVHKSQGATVESAIVHHNPEAGGSASYNSLNVAATRATHEMQVLTSDKEALNKQVQGIDEKTTTIREHGQDQDKGQEQNQGIKTDAEQKLDDKLNSMDGAQRTVAENEINAASKGIDGDKTEQAIATVEAAEKGATQSELENHQTVDQQQQDLQSSVAELKNDLNQNQDQQQQEAGKTDAASNLSTAVTDLKNDIDTANNNNSQKEQPGQWQEQNQQQGQDQDKGQGDDKTPPSPEPEIEIDGP